DNHCKIFTGRHRDEDEEDEEAEEAVTDERDLVLLRFRTTGAK
ncbi:unnamed protein product, partial [Arabidopsis halleri]